jgi:hypothetical protein
MVNLFCDHSLVSPFSTITYDTNNINGVHCVRGGATGGTGSGVRFGSADYSVHIFDHLSGLTWAMQVGEMESNPAAAMAMCANKQGKWRLPTLGELRQLAWRDPTMQSSGSSLPFSWKYYIASSPPPPEWSNYAWHILFPAGGTDHGPDLQQVSTYATPWVTVACVKVD